MEYNGYKFLDTIMLICRDTRESAESYGCTTTVTTDIYQAYLVDPANKKQLEAARNWAAWMEYGPYNKETKEYEWKIKHEPVEFTFENTRFGFELLDCAGGSSQGGKLSFWNCIVTKDDMRFKIGINSEMLLSVLKEGSFTNGKCNNTVCFASQKGNCGVVIEDGETYKLAKKDMELKSNISKSLTTKYKPGDHLVTTTINEVYLGKFYRYYTFKDEAYNRWGYWSRERSDYRDCILIKHKKPIPVYLFTNRNAKVSLGDKPFTKVSQLCESEKHYYLYSFDKLPRRAIGPDPIEMDLDEKSFSDLVFKKHNIFNSEEETKKWTYAYTDIKLATQFADTALFGVAAEPFELSDEMMNLFKEHKVKIIEE